MSLSRPPPAGLEPGASGPWGCAFGAETTLAGVRRKGGSGFPRGGGKPGAAAGRTRHVRVVRPGTGRKRRPTRNAQFRSTRPARHLDTAARPLVAVVLSWPTRTQMAFAGRPSTPCPPPPFEPAASRRCRRLCPAPPRPCDPPCAAHGHRVAWPPERPWAGALLPRPGDGRAAVADRCSALICVKFCDALISLCTQLSRPAAKRDNTARCQQ